MAKRADFEEGYQRSLTLSVKSTLILKLQAFLNKNTPHKARCLFQFGKIKLLRGC